jgi:succinate dehydrogenase/fumarate reductase-like Fe-S protein
MSGFVINFEGEQVAARAGESVAAALTAHGIRGFRVTRSTAERGIFCGMGVCQECRVLVNGYSQLACQTLCAPGMVVETGAAA